jgi:hypothetical protein
LFYFSFKPGDYINLNLPHVALYEFHPFTISSAPEQTDVLHVHIQAIGNWTKRVYNRFKDISENNGDQEVDVIVHRADRDPIKATNEEKIESKLKRKKELIIINGPYSSCARYVFDCDHAILIGGGIGVTPYASILSSLMTQFCANQHCQNRKVDQTILVENRRLKKVDFIWVIRDHRSFEWFIKLLHQFEEEQQNYLLLNPNEHRFLTIHLYFTSVTDDECVGHYPFQLITQLWAQAVGHDIFTGLKSRTHIGRPEWNKIFDQIESKNKNVNVFYCGNQTMGRTIQQASIKHRFRFYQENF